MEGSGELSPKANHLGGEGFSTFRVDGEYRTGFFYREAGDPNGKKFFAFIAPPADGNTQGALVVRTVREQKNGVSLGTVAVEIPAIYAAELLKAAGAGGQA